MNFCGRPEIKTIPAFLYQEIEGRRYSEILMMKLPQPITQLRSKHFKTITSFKIGESARKSLYTLLFYLSTLRIGFKETISFIQVHSLLFNGLLDAL